MEGGLVADKSAIEWTNATWNPITGCTKVSPGCDHCYAETFAERWRGAPGHPYENGFDLQLRPERLDIPIRWTKPRMIFVNSMSDLFHKDIPDEYIAQVFAVMVLAPRHTFQLLTKRHGRMRSLLSSADFKGAVLAAATLLAHEPGRSPALLSATWEEDWWPLRNVWLGVSVEDQTWADLRIPALLRTPAAVRWISAEPLLGPVKLPIFCDCGCGKPIDVARREARVDSRWLNPDQAEAGITGTTGLDWVVVGGESGPGARPMHPDWARSLRDQCEAADVPFLFKQHGSWVGYSTPESPWREKEPTAWVSTSGETRPYDGPTPQTGDWLGMWRVSKHAAGRQLDGRTYDGYPREVKVP